MLFSSRSIYTGLLATAVCLLSACDSGGPEEPPGPTAASITLDVQSVRSAGDCDSGATAPAEYQFRVGVLDAGNNVVSSVDLPVNSSYGTVGAEDDFVLLRAGQTATFDSNLSFQRSLDASGSFSVAFSATEWDASGMADARLDDLMETRSHAYANGQFSDIVGTKTVRVRGDAACDVTLTYSLAVQ